MKTVVIAKDKSNGHLVAIWSINSANLYKQKKTRMQGNVLESILVRMRLILCSQVSTAAPLASMSLVSQPCSQLRFNVCCSKNYKM